jgi:transcriptional regulator GlxA family with amidase domain
MLTRADAKWALGEQLGLRVVIQGWGVGEPQVQGVIAEYERAKIAERYRRGKLFRSRAGEVLAWRADRPERNVGLDELAAAAGIGKFRLVRLFRERTGLPPHALQIAHRVRMARGLLEGGDTIADIATAPGFADQSHLHRHFQRSLGLTPGGYRIRFTH